jgi:protein import protein ZIM17
MNLVHLLFHQCCGCNIFHKLVDNLNLFHEMKCYVGPDFRYEGDAPFNYLDGGEDGDNIFPVL